MKKMYFAMGTMLLVCSSMLAQSAPSQQTGAQSTGASPGMQMQSTQKPQGMQGMKNHSQEMQAEMQEMKSRVEKMKTDAAKVKDADTKAALLDNADMWEQFMDHMQSHMSMMMEGGMHHGGMMQHKKTPPSPPAQSAPPSPQ